jgi:hypothetical protein
MKKIGDNNNLVSLPLELLYGIKGCPNMAGVLKTIKEEFNKVTEWISYAHEACIQTDQI